ncbi:MAG: ATP-dependent 6-phosphofructokinase [Candidatus Latescibacterota bacterium]
MLESARSEAFRTKRGQRTAVTNLKKQGIEGLVVIGGDGSFRGAHELAGVWRIPTIGVPASIDNDITGTDFSIGFDTASNTALDAIDRIRDTAASHERLFVIEVMGRLSGAIALQCAVAGGAEEVLIPETVSDIPGMCQRLVAGRKRGKTSSIIIIAEGDETGGAFKVAEQISDLSGYDVRVSVLGHLQRGGSPSALDRVLASRLGAAAVEQLIRGQSDKMVGVVANQIEVSNLDYAWKVRKSVDMNLLSLLGVLAS